MNSEFIIILEIEVKLIISIIIVFINNDAFIIVFFILLNNIIFNIAIDVLRTGGTNETVVIV